MIARCPSPRCGHSEHEVLVYTPSPDEAAHGWKPKQILPFHLRSGMREPCIFSGTTVYDYQLIEAPR
jgi:hypothetical protein